PDPLSILHEAAAHRFVIRLPGGEGRLLYDVRAPAVLDLRYAEVSPALRGQGIAGALVEAACEYARARELKLIPSCPYVAWWFTQHPEQRDLLDAG
ncbi:MAG TPA: GNAT family N-acetyltransferase, partial [Gemmatimonadales bacterium]|nr:GNAT family N-acetyltransferase [Gemmatimonadales bacterium]